MSRNILCVWGLLAYMIIGVLVTQISASDVYTAPGHRQKDVIVLHTDTHIHSTTWSLISHPRVGKSGNPFKIELQAARSRTEGWLHAKGFSLLKERDAYGKHTYSLVSRAFDTEWPTVYFRIRVGRPAFAAGLHPRREAPAIGFTVPCQQYLFEVESLADRDMGYMLLGSIRWHAPQQQRLQYGLAFPVTLERTRTIGALLQVRSRLGG